MKLTYWLEPLIVKSIWLRYEDSFTRYDIVSLYSPSYKTSLEIEVKYKNDTPDSVSYYLTRKTNESIVVPGFLSEEYKDMKISLLLNKRDKRGFAVENIECGYDKFKLKNLNFKYVPSGSSLDMVLSHKFTTKVNKQTNDNLKMIIDILSKIYLGEIDTNKCEYNLILDIEY